VGVPQPVQRYFFGRSRSFRGGIDDPSSLGNIQTTGLLAAKYGIDRAADATEASSRFQVFGFSK
jgi:hypothetical protein